MEVVGQKEEKEQDQEEYKEEEEKEQGEENQEEELRPCPWRKPLSLALRSTRHQLSS